MSGHTPGEWIATYTGNGEWEIASNGPDRDDVACVCVVAGGLGHSMEDNWDYESEANARLIESAPKLKRSLEQLIKILDMEGIKGPAIDNARNALDCTTIEHWG